MTLTPVNSGLTLQDFNPFPRWKNYLEMRNPASPLIPSEELSITYIQDTKTERIYPNINDHDVRIEAFSYLIKTPIWQTLMSVVNIAIRLFRIVTFYHFRFSEPSPLKKTMLDLINILLTPIGLVAMEIAALFAVMVNPKGGMKVYGSLEKLVFDKIPLPILQPDFSATDILTSSSFTKNKMVLPENDEFNNFDEFKDFNRFYKST